MLFATDQEIRVVSGPWSAPRLLRADEVEEAA